MQQQASWYNFKTKEYDLYEGSPPDEKANEYVSQNPAAQGLYECRVKMGDTPLEAMEQVLLACLPATE